MFGYVICIWCICIRECVCNLFSSVLLSIAIKSFDSKIEQLQVKHDCKIYRNITILLYCMKAKRKVIMYMRKIFVFKMHFIHIAFKFRTCFSLNSARYCNHTVLTVVTETKKVWNMWSNTIRQCTFNGFLLVFSDKENWFIRDNDIFISISFI